MEMYKMIRMTVMKNTLGLVDAHCSDWLVRGGAGGQFVYGYAVIVAEEPKSQNQRGGTTC